MAERASARELSPLDLLQHVAAPEGTPVPPPRTIIFVAHPDDEVIALGARLSRYCDALFVRATDGAPQDGGDAAAHGFSSLDAYRSARREELYGALRLAGISSTQAITLGFADQAAGHCLPELISRAHALLVEHEPEVVITHPYEGGHPDHDACAFAVRAACTRLGRRKPAIVEGAFYHQGADGIETSCFLPGRNEHEVLACRLNEAEQARKEALFASFVSQTETLQWFRRDLELFRLAPEYDFAQRPHAGKLFYEFFPWGMTGDQFCALAMEAQKELALCR